MLILHCEKSILNYSILIHSWVRQHWTYLLFILIFALEVLVFEHIRGHSPSRFLSIHYSAFSPLFALLVAPFHPAVLEPDFNLKKKNQTLFIILLFIIIIIIII